MEANRTEVDDVSDMNDLICHMFLLDLLKEVNVLVDHYGTMRITNYKNSRHITCSPYPPIKTDSRETSKIHNARLIFSSIA